MVTTTLKKSNREINWISPDVDYSPTAEEFKTMIQKSESSPKMSFEQYQKKMNKWLTKNI